MAENFSGRLLRKKPGETAACRTEEQSFVLQQISSSTDSATFTPPGSAGSNTSAVGAGGAQWHLRGETATAEENQPRNELRDHREGSGAAAFSYKPSTSLRNTREKDQYWDDALPKTNIWAGIISPLKIQPEMLPLLQKPQWTPRSPQHQTTQLSQRPLTLPEHWGALGKGIS